MHKDFTAAYFPQATIFGFSQIIMVMEGKQCYLH
jgi:hypothetical protein